MAEQPIRRHVDISARDSAQLELRLHWFARALAARQGYIVALRRRASASGRQVATVSYELQLPRALPPAPSRRRRSAGARRYAGERALSASSSSSGSL